MDTFAQVVLISPVTAEGAAAFNKAAQYPEEHEGMPKAASHKSPLLIDTKKCHQTLKTHHQKSLYITLSNRAPHAQCCWFVGNYCHQSNASLLPSPLE